MDNINILLEQDLAEEPFASIMSNIWNHPANDCQILHNFFDNRGEIREENLQWLEQHPMPSKTICAAFVPFFNHFTDNSWLDFFWDRFINGHSEEELNQKKYGNKILYTATEVMNAYGLGISLDVVKEYCDRYGDKPSHLSVAFHNYVCDGIGNKEKTISLLEDRSDGLKGKNQQQKEEIVNLNTQIGEYLMMLVEKDDTIHDLMKQADTMRESLKSKEGIIRDLHYQQSVLNNKIKRLQQDAELSANSTPTGKHTRFWRKHTRRIKLREFKKLDEVSQREAIIRLILEKPGENDAFPVVKKLLEDNKIGNEFLYTFLLDNPDKSCLNDLLVLFGMEDGQHDNAKGKAAEIGKTEAEKTASISAVPEEKDEESAQGGIIVEESEDEEDENEYY